MQYLNINMQCIQFNINKLNKKEKVRVTLSSYPHENHQFYIFDTNKKKNKDCFFNMNIKIATNNPKILFTFEKKQFLQNDSLIASSSISSNQILESKNDSSNRKILMLNLYEPINSNNYKIINQFENSIIGSMIILFYFDEEIKKHDLNIGKIHKGGGYSLCNNENTNQNHEYDLLDY